MSYVDEYMAGACYSLENEFQMSFRDMDFLKVCLNWLIDFFFFFSYLSFCLEVFVLVCLVWFYFLIYVYFKEPENKSKPTEIIM